MHKRKYRTDYLFARPSFLEGMARVLDIGGTFDANAYNTSSTPEAADERALRSDWLMVGQDMQYAMDQVRAEVDAILGRRTNS